MKPNVPYKAEILGFMTKDYTKKKKKRKEKKRKRKYIFPNITCSCIYDYLPSQSHYISSLSVAWNYPSTESTPIILIHNTLYWKHLLLTSFVKAEQSWKLFSDGSHEDCSALLYGEPKNETGINDT